MYLLATASAAQQPAQQGTTDHEFAMKASAANLAEVNMGKLALEKSGNADVKKFAEHMVKDHGKANKDLNHILDQQRLQPASTMDPKHEALATRMSALSGEAFDHSFAQHMVQDHKEAISLFENEAKHGQDSALKAFAQKTLPTLREHLKDAERLPGAKSDHSGTDRERTNRSNRNQNPR
jgi:putative membrane protein